MNKNDFKFIFIVLILSVLIILFYKLFCSKNNGQAFVYYDGNLVKMIDLTIDDLYVVSGENGDVVIEVVDGKIRVKDENSPLHLCSRQGFIEEGYESIVCLPNKIVINIGSSDIDAVVK